MTLIARGANDVPGIARARQRGFSGLAATFGLKRTVGGAVSSARNTNLATIYAAAALLGISHNFRRRQPAHARRKKPAQLAMRGPIWWQLVNGF
jgi:hypothetical protein